MQKTESDMSGENTLSGIVSPLLDWYDENARTLPWRENTEPYRVWVSEIMLQQTQVDTVIPYYNRFMDELPDIKSLANADEERLLKLWEGLGYYGRARNLQKCARIVMEKYGGRFPDSYKTLLTLPGIGSYTAGAIASICFGEPVPAVDGNVLRVVARVTCSRADIARPEVKKQVAGMLGEIYPETRSGDFTQSLMELGATVCLPNRPPLCDACPLGFLCRAKETGEQSALPVKSDKKPRKKEQKTVFLLRFGDKVAVRRREKNALLGGLWEFPNVPGELSAGEAENTLGRWGVQAASLAEGIHARHIFTHVEWKMTSYMAACENMTETFLWVTKEKLTNEMTVPSAFRAFLSVI